MQTVDHPDLVAFDTWMKQRIQDVLTMEADHYDAVDGPPAGNTYLWNELRITQQALRRNT